MRLIYTHESDVTEFYTCMQLHAIRYLLLQGLYGTTSALKGLGHEAELKYFDKHMGEILVIRQWTGLQDSSLILSNTILKWFHLHSNRF